MARRILVADESQNVQRNVKVILSQEGYEVSGVSDMAALEAAIGKFRPHLVLVDVELPPTDGYMACRAIKEDEVSSDVAVLLMVGTFVVLDRSGMDACRAEGFITKPFDPLALRARVREVMRELEDTHRIKLESVPRKATHEVLAEVEALSGVPEIAADDFGELEDQDETFPQIDDPPSEAIDDAVASAAPTREHGTELAGGDERPAAGGTAAPPPRLVAFVQKIRETIAAPVEEPLTEAERRIIEDNEAVLRVVASDPEDGSPIPGSMADEGSDLSSLVAEADAASEEAAPAPPPPVGEATDRIPLGDSASLLAAAEATESETSPVEPPAAVAPEEHAETAAAPSVEEGAVAETSSAPPDAELPEGGAMEEEAPEASSSQVTQDEEEEAASESLEDAERNLGDDVAVGAIAADGLMELSGARFDPPTTSTVEAPAYANEETSVITRVSQVVPPAVHVEAPASAPAAEAAVPSAAVAAATIASEQELVERIVGEVVRRLSDAVVREIAWEVVPELAKLYVEKKLREQ